MDSPKNFQDFYRKFEDRFRGSPNFIKKSLENRYKARIKQLFLHFNHYNQLESLDLGCGRGEMLSIMHECGFHPSGIDQSKDMLASSKLQDSISVFESDILAFLKDQPSESFSFITCMHVIEHCNFEYNYHIFEQANRVLRPQGVFLIETPSLFSLWSSSRQFYLDPTHSNPLHPSFIDFMAEYHGFDTREILQFTPPVQQECGSPSRHIIEPKLKAEMEKIEDWLYGPMDLAVWSTK